MKKPATKALHAVRPMEAKKAMKVMKTKAMKKAAKDITKRAKKTMTTMKMAAKVQPKNAMKAVMKAKNAMKDAKKAMKAKNAMIGKLVVGCTNKFRLGRIVETWREGEGAEAEMMYEVQFPNGISACLHPHEFLVVD
jgi:hypothetical protein